jgi:excisionase family DNA binding protein
MGDSNTAGENEPQGGVLAHIKRAAAFLGLSQYQVQNLIDEGRLPAEKIGGRTYIRVDDLHTFAADFGRRSA